MATFNLSTGVPILRSDSARVSDRLASCRTVADAFALEPKNGRMCLQSKISPIRCRSIAEQREVETCDGSLDTDQDVSNSPIKLQSNGFPLSRTKLTTNSRRKTKIVCTIGPSTSSREMIWKLAETGMNVARLNMSHGDHSSHQKTIDLVKEYNAQFKDKVIAIMLDTKGPEVRSGDVPQPILLKEGQEFNFTIKRGVSTEDTVSVNYDDFVNDVEVGDILLVDGW